MTHVFAVKLMLSHMGSSLTVRVGSNDVAAIYTTLNTCESSTTCEMVLLDAPIWRTQDCHEALGHILGGLGLDPMSFLGSHDQFAHQVAGELIKNLSHDTIPAVFDIGVELGWPCIQQNDPWQPRHKDQGCYFSEADVHEGVCVKLPDLRVVGYTQACHGDWSVEHMASQVNVELLEDLQQTCPRCGCWVYIDSLGPDKLPCNLGVGFEAFCSEMECPLCQDR